MKEPKTIIFTSIGVLTGGIIVSKFCFNNFLSLKKFLCSVCYSCAACSITATSTIILRHTRWKTASESYQITALLVSLVGTLVYRYELYCSKEKLMPYNIFWKYFYPWIVFSIFPSIFICGFKSDVDIYALQQASGISAIGMLLGILTPINSDNSACGVIQSIKNFIFEYNSIFIAGIGCGFIITKLILVFTEYSFHSLFPYTDLFFLGLVMIIFGFTIEDTKVLKEQSQSSDDEYEFDAVVASIPLYIDMLLLFLFTVELIEPFYFNKSY